MSYRSGWTIDIKGRLGKKILNSSNKASPIEDANCQPPVQRQPWLAHRCSPPPLPYFLIKSKKQSS